MQNSFTIINNKTNEKVEGYGVIVQKRAPHPYRDNGVQVSQAALERLATNTTLSKRALRIAIWLISQVPRQPPMRLTRRDISDALGMHKSDVTKGLQELHALPDQHDEYGECFQAILPVGKKPIVGVRPSVAWKGPSAELVAAIQAERAADRAFAESLTAKPVMAPDAASSVATTDPAVQDEAQATLSAEAATAATSVSAESATSEVPAPAAPESPSKEGTP